MVGLVHRDIKPANLLLDRRGSVKILDLGIVRLLGDDTQPPGSEPEEILGTLDYLAPEQAENSASVDARADLYALGATLYFLLAGHPPFPGTDLRHKLAAKQFSDPPPIHRLRPDVDPALSGVIHTLLTRNAASRYQTAVEAIAALSPFAALPADFPRRFFHPLHRSTVTDGSALDRDSSPVAPTQSIRKPGFHATAASPPPPPVQATDDPGPTVRISKALTDMTMDALPNAPQAAPQEGQKPDQTQSVPPRSHRVLVWVLPVILAVIAIVAVAWIWLRQN
jgi:eukaryotic-like serine/threonine-protein kinase